MAFLTIVIGILVIPNLSQAQGSPKYKDIVYATVDGKELSAPTQGKYACGCGEGCNCGSISQKPGKCACGKDMVKVKK